MYTSKDRMMLEKAYINTQQKLKESHLAGGMSSVPVIVTMDMPGARTSTVPSEDHTEQHDEGEVSMAHNDLRKLAEYAAKLEELVERMPSLEGWVAAKITKAADYISSVYDYLGSESNHECGCDDHDTEVDMFDTGYEDTDDFCVHAAMGCKCGGCPSCH